MLGGTKKRGLVDDHEVKRSKPAPLPVPPPAPNHKRGAEALDHPSKQANTCDTGALDQLDAQLSKLSVNTQNATPDTFADNVVGIFYQKLATSATPQTLKKVENTYGEIKSAYPDLKSLNTFKGWALGMAVTDGNLPVVLHLLENAEEVIHMGHLNYAIKQAQDIPHAEILHVLEEYKDNFISREIAKRRGRVATFG